MEDITLTWQELLRNEWFSYAVDNNSNVVPGVLGRPIKAFWHGDREVITGNEIPAIVIDSESMTPEWEAFRVQIQEYNFDVIGYVRESDADDSKSVVHEMARIIKIISERNSRWWVFHECFFDKELFYDPQYLIDNYSSILNPYVADVVSDYEGDWNSHHTAYSGGGTPPVPESLDTKDKYVSAYIKLFYEDPLTSAWATDTLTYTDKEGRTHDTTTRDLIALARSENIAPVKFMSDTKIKNINYGYVYKGSELLYAVQISMYSKEHLPITEFGPV